MTKRDIKGKFALKNEEHRLVRSLRLTDSTWEKLGAAAEASGVTRADWLEQVVRMNDQDSPCMTPKKKEIQQPDEAEKGLQENAQPKFQVAFSLEDLEILCLLVLKDLKLGKQAPQFKSAQKVLKHLLTLAHRSGTSLP